MSDFVIRAEGLGKKYLIGHTSRTERNATLRDVMSRTARGLMRSASDMLHGRQLIAGDEVEEFWALRDVNFEVKRGDVVGIIGRNGAGKSTLLKILSRITEPTEGRVELKGRVASLLEVGTGFHPELTGRENIYLNGAILGMSRAEIHRKFDEIVAFAEVERFLDTPVKRYSSGMYVRLAFAVAAHLEPEILIVDEVLAVGDAEFQKKCLGKMRDVAGDGRTVLFVSHNMSAVSILCSHVVVMLQGAVHYAGPKAEGLAAYGLLSSKPDLTTKRARREQCTIEQVSAEVVRNSGASTLAVSMTVYAKQPAAVSIELVLSDRMGTPVAYFEHGTLDKRKRIELAQGSTRLQFALNLRPFADSQYSISARITDPGICVWDRVDDVCQFQNVRGDTGLIFVAEWENGCVHYEIEDVRISQLQTVPEAEPVSG